MHVKDTKFTKSVFQSNILLMREHFCDDTNNSAKKKKTVVIFHKRRKALKELKIISYNGKILKSLSDIFQRIRVLNEAEAITELCQISPQCNLANNTRSINGPLAYSDRMSPDTSGLFAILLIYSMVFATNHFVPLKNKRPLDL